MAANNMKAVKLRIKSVQSTMQITKAMEPVSYTHLRREGRSDQRICGRRRFSERV